MSGLELNLFALQFKALGSVCELKLYLPSEKEATSILNEVVSLVCSYQDKYSRYNPNSLISIINSRAGTGVWTELDNESFQLINFANVLNEQSDGLFDITSGILRRVWDFRSNCLPSPSQIAPLLSKVGWHKVKFKDRSILLPEEGMELDVGGFVKEYIADAVASFCSSFGVKHGLVNLGGDIHVIGPHPDGKPWGIGITHPRDAASSAITSTLVSRGGVATSGDYERYMQIDGVRYCHILNPKSGISIQPMLCSVTVFAESCLIAGSFATSAMLKSETNTNWLVESTLPNIIIDQELNISSYKRG